MAIGKNKRRSASKKPVFPRREKVVAKQRVNLKKGFVSKFRPLPCPANLPYDDNKLRSGAKGKHNVDKLPFFSLNGPRRRSSHMRVTRDLRCCEGSLGNRPKRLILHRWKRKPKDAGDDEMAFLPLVAARCHCAPCLKEALVQKNKKHIANKVDCWGRSVADYAVIYCDPEMLRKAIALGSSPAQYKAMDCNLGTLISKHARKCERILPGCLEGHVSSSAPPFDERTKEVFDILWARRDCQEALRRSDYFLYQSLCRFLMRNYEKLSPEEIDRQVKLGRGW